MLPFLPNRTDFTALYGHVQAVPIYCSLLSDRLTPVSAFERLAQGTEHAFLLESVIGGEKIARYSFLGASPIALIEAKDRRTVLTDPTGVHVFNDVDPLEKLEEILSRYRAAHPVELPRFLGGAVGYASYDIARHYEGTLGSPPPDDRDLPDLQFGIYDRMVVFDHVRKIVHVIAHTRPQPGNDSQAAYDEACAGVEAIVNKLAIPGTPGPEPIKLLLPGAAGRDWEPRPVRQEGRKGPSRVACEVPSDYDSTMTPARFEQAVDRCKEYIRAGDIFQVVLSQRLTATTPASPFNVYRALRVVNPSPFMFFVQSPSVTLVGASPEILCRQEGRTVSTRPLAGTRGRGRTEAEDLGLEKELLADPKERAEHVMLVDLGRNDLGRICQPGTVELNEVMSVERYSHVMHLCSHVSGTLAAGKTAFDAVRSVLPVGTVSGAPKIRAMQIIDELEPVQRGPYAGAVGYIDFAGNMDTCIALRTLVITPGNADGQWRVDAQVGAGIVADSEPSREFRETLRKAECMLAALDIAKSWAGEETESCM